MHDHLSGFVGGTNKTGGDEPAVCMVSGGVSINRVATGLPSPSPSTMRNGETTQYIFASSSCLPFSGRSYMAP